MDRDRPLRNKRPLVKGRNKQANAASLASKPDLILGEREARLKSAENANGDQLSIMLRAVPIVGQRTSGQKPANATAGSCELYLHCVPVADPESGQAMHYGFYQVQHRGDPVFLDDGRIEAGFFYNPKTITPRTLAVVQTFAAQKSLRIRKAWDVTAKDPEAGRFVVTEHGFVSAVLLKYGWELRGTIIGSDLSRDLGLLALRSAPGRRGPGGSGLPGGFSLTVCANTFKPRLKINRLGDAFSIRWEKPTKSVGWSRSIRNRIDRGDQPPPPFWSGRFVDILDVGQCLYSDSFEEVAGLAARLGITAGTREPVQCPELEYSNAVTTSSLERLMRNVEDIGCCYAGLGERFAGFGLGDGVGLHDLFSAASIAKLHLRKMGIDSRAAASGLPSWLIAALMVTLHGGRAEVHIPHRVAQGRYCDARSMYPTVAAPQGLWRFAVANGSRWRDTTAETQAFLGAVQLADLLKPETWPRLLTIVYLQPNDDVVPVRAPYTGGEELTTAANHLISDGLICFTLADIVVSKLLSGLDTTLKIARAISFAPGPRQVTLSPHAMFANPEWIIDPRTDDCFLRFAKLRQQVKIADREGLDANRRERLDLADPMLKTMANAGCSGIFAELHVDSFDKPQAVHVILDAGPMEDAKPVSKRMRHVEKPGSFFHPLIASLVYGGARLMLAIVERLIIDNGLEWAFCDTDSMFIVQPENVPFEEFNWRCELVQSALQKLDPYKDGNPLLKTEPENFDRDTGELIPTGCCAIVPKRYVLFNFGRASEVDFRKVSRHALGTMLPPDPNDKALRDIGRRFHREIWLAGINAKLTGRPADLGSIPGITKPAMSRIVNHSPELGVHQSIRPGTPLSSFVMKDQYAKDRTGNPIHPIAIFHPDPDVAARGCFNRVTKEPIPTWKLKTYEDVVHGFFDKIDPKFRMNECGVAERRHVIVADVQFIGKEADRIEDKALTRGQVDTPEIRYGGSHVLCESIRNELAGIAHAWGGASKLAKRLRMHPDTLLKLLRGEPVNQSRLNYVLRSLPYLKPHVVADMSELKNARLAEVRARVQAWVQRATQAEVAKAIGIARDSLDRFLKGKEVSQKTIAKLERRVQPK